MSQAARYAEVEGMINKLVWERQRLTGIPFEDLKSEANHSFMKVCDSFNPSKGAKFSTWCFTKVRNHLKDYARKKSRERLVFFEELKDEILPPVAPNESAARLALVERLKDLSPEAYRFIETLLENEEPDRSPREILRLTCMEMQELYGYDNVYTKIICHEIKAELGNGKT